jgi:hypothetical protein
MELLAPAQLLWLGLAGPLILLYVLKRRRTERVVGSTLLWSLALRDMRAERPWKRLMPHLSLLLQLLVLVAGAIALARPAGAGGAVSGARTAVIIDTSASMAAIDGEEVRLDAARRVLSSLSRGLPPGGDMMLIEAATEPAVIAAPTRDATQIETVLSRLEVRGGRADLEAAVSLAAERLRGAPDGSRILLLTDAAIDGEIALDGRTAPVEVQRIGDAAPNDAIVAVDVRPRATEEHPDRADVFVRVRRFASSPADLFVTARAGERTVASRRVTLEANGTESVVLVADLPPDDTGRAPIVHVALSREDGATDAFSLDDTAVVPSPGARKLPIFLIGAPVPSVERVFRADRDAEIFATTLGALAARDDSAPPLDGLFVYLGETPEQAPAGDSLVVAPTGERVFEMPLGEMAESPRIVTWDEDDARMRFVSLSDVHLGAIRPVRGPAARTLVSTDQGPAIASVERPDGETTVVAFDPAQTDWAQNASFVVFFRNILERARRHRAEGGVPAGRVGEALRVPAPDGTRVSVRSPSGQRLEAEARGGVAVVAVPPEAGVFEVTTGRRTLFALRNLLDAEESDLSPRARFTRGDREAVGAAAATEHMESWPWFAGALVLLLLFEALWATRKGAA